MFEKRAYLSLLFDFYGGLLTEKQRLMFDLYYQCDLSLGEIAEEHRISRQAVYDIIKRTENVLEEYEKKLKLVQKFQLKKEELQKALYIIDDIKNKKQIDTIQINKLKKIITSVMEH